MDYTVSKNTYIDDIIKKNTKKNYPIPGPGVHFLDNKLIDRWHSKDKDIFKMPAKQTKKDHNLPQARRTFGERPKAWVLGPDYRKTVKLVIIYILIEMYHIGLMNISYAIILNLLYYKN